MKKNFVKALALSLVVALYSALPIQASGTLVKEADLKKINRESSIISDREKDVLSSVYGQTRGSIISTATVILTNEGEGKVDIIVETLAHKKVDEIFHTVILEQLQSDDSWLELGRYDYDVVKEDCPDQDLSGLTNEFKLSNLEINRYYRLRGIHFVYLDGKSQAFSTDTDALYLKKYPG